VATGDVIKIAFEVEGVAALRATFDSLEQRMVRFDRASVASTERGATTRVRVTKREVDDRARDLANLSRRSEAAEQIAVKAAQRGAADRVRAATDLSRQIERAQSETTRALEAEERKRTANARREATSRARQEEQDARRSVAVRRQYNQRVVGSVTTGLGNFASTGARLVGGLGGIGAGFAVADAMRQEMSFNRAVTQASNAAYVAGDPERTREKASPSRIAALSRAVQFSTNVDKTEVANAIHAYVGKASDFAGISSASGLAGAGGKTNMEILAMMAKGSGGSLDEYVRAAASLKASNPALTTDQMMTTMLGVVGAGKKGNLPIEELARSVPNISAASKIFAGDATQNQRKLLGLAQLVGPATGGADEAAMALKHLGEGAMVSARTGRGGLTARDIYEGGDPRHGLIGPAQLLGNIYRRTNGRNDLAEQMLGERGFKVYEALHDTYAAAGGGEKGAVAVEKRVGEFENVKQSMGDVMTDFATVMATDGERIDKAFKHIEDLVERRGAPILERFATSLEKNEGSIEKFIQVLGDAADFMVSHPWTSLALALEANIVKSIVAAAIGSKVRDALLKALSGIGGVGSGGGGGGGTALVPATGGGGVLGFIGNALKATAIVYGASSIAASLDAGGTGDTKGETARKADLDLLAKTSADLNAGKISPGQAAAVYNRVQGRVASASEGIGAKGQVLDMGGAAVAALPGQIGAVGQAQVSKWHEDNAYLGKGQWGGDDKALIESLDRLSKKLGDLSGKGDFPPTNVDLGSSGIAGGPAAVGHPARSATLSDPSRGGVGR
jgi:hypothetical protein